MHILVTGSEGLLGRWVVAALHQAGHELRTLDLAARRPEDGLEHLPGDIRNLHLVRRAVQGMDAVVHLAALAGDFGPQDALLSINVQGTWNVVLACREAGVARVVYASSINVLGCVGGCDTAACFPLDDDYPCHPAPGYQLSKLLGEEACRSYSYRYGMVTICLRFALLVSPDRAGMRRHPLDRPTPARVESGAMDYWSYVDMRDACDAVLCGLAAHGLSHGRFLVAAADTIVDVPTAELVDSRFPQIPWKVDRAAYLAGNPYRSLVDCRHAGELLGWQPRRSWRDDP